MTITHRMLGSFAIFAGIGALIYTGAVVWSGSAATVEAAMQLGPLTILLGAAAASSGYLARLLRWHCLLVWLGHRLSVGFNLRVYLAGLALTTSPAKLGETVRSLLLLPRGVGIPHSLAAFFADRLSDVIGVALLGAAGGWIAGRREVALEIVALAVLLLSFVAQAIVRSRYWKRRVGSAGTGRRRDRWIAAIASPASAWARVWNLRRALLCASCGFIAFGIQGCVFASFVEAAGVSLSAAQCVTIFASATLIGAASMIPAGLGAMEGALVYQLVGVGVAATDAVAVAIVTRVATLWCGLLLGSIALLSLAHNPDAGGVANRKPLDRS